MNILAWVLFGVINGLVLYLFDDKRENVHPGIAVTLGVLGALCGGTAAYVLFGGLQSGFNSTLILVIFFEAILLFFLLTDRSTRHIS